MLLRPFLLCVHTIEQCRLNTDNPEFPERNTGVSASGADEDGPAAGGEATPDHRERIASDNADEAQSLGRSGTETAADLTEGNGGDPEVTQGEQAKQAASGGWRP